MFKDKYIDYMDSVRPDSELVLSVLASADKKRARKRPLLRAVLAVCIIVCLSPAVLGAAAAAGVDEAYHMMYALSPKTAQYFKSVNMTDEYDGIVMEVVSAAVVEDTAEILITMHDEKGDRIDGTVDLFDSYSINRPFSSSATCSLESYDEETKTAAFRILITQWNGKDISGEKITFSVRKFLSHKTEYDNIKLSLDISALVEAESVRNKKANGEHGSVDTEILVSGEPTAFEVDDMYITAAGYAEDKLHIQIMTEDITKTDNHGYIYLKDKDGNKIACEDCIRFRDEKDGKRIDYMEFIFDVSPDNAQEYDVYGYFVTADMLTEGDWQVTFPLN